MSGKAFTALELERRLQKYLDPVLSPRRTAAEPALSLVELSLPLQQFVLHWVSVIVKTNSEMGFQFAAAAAKALQLMDREDTEAWILHAMDIYDRQGLYPACTAIQGVERYAAALADHSRTVLLREVAAVLQHFAVGLSGRDLNIQSCQATYTDTEVLYLPDRLCLFNDRHDNFILYKSIVTFLWAQTRFGTFAQPRQHLSLSQMLSSFADVDRARQLFHALETIRLNACIRAELPAMHAEMLALQSKIGAIDYPTDWYPILEALKAVPSSVTNTYQALGALYLSNEPLPARFCFQGELLIAEVEQRSGERRLREKFEFQNALEEVRRKMSVAAATEGKHPLPPAQLRTKVNEAGEAIDFELTINDRPVFLPQPVRLTAQSILRDFGEIPADYLIPGGAGDYPSPPTSDKLVLDANIGAGDEQKAYLYDEWDFRRRHYRKDWCILHELDVRPLNTDFVSRTLSRYSYLLSDLRKAFEALRGEDSPLKKQQQGNDIDLDAVVEAFADNAAGLETSDKLFVRLNKIERDMAAMFLVDMSGSTKGWINDAEREALVLLCEALEVLGDRYAIYGFSGMTRKRCELYRVKTFDEAYDEQVKKRISGIKPQDYTRMGVTIRHLTRLLRSIEARTKLLVTLSDGKPDDYDGYRGEYGIEDTRQALIEAKNEGVHAFCITIDSRAGEYLPHMYGAVNYVLVDEIRKLPLKVADIYRKLTT